MIKFTLLLSLIFITIQTQARGPAIEPGRGISIDHYDHSNNKNDPGFNWKESNKGRNIEVAPRNYRKVSSKKGNPYFSVLIASAFIIFPVILWFSILRKLGDTQTPVQQNSSVISLDQYRKENDKDNEGDDHNDDHFSKAS